MRIGFANCRAKSTLRLQPLNTVLGVMKARSRFLVASILGAIALTLLAFLMSDLANIDFDFKEVPETPFSVNIQSIASNWQLNFEAKGGWNSGVRVTANYDGLNSFTSTKLSHNASCPSEFSTPEMNHLRDLVATVVTRPFYIPQTPPENGCGDDIEYNIVIWSKEDSSPNMDMSYYNRFISDPKCASPDIEEAWFELGDFLHTFARGREDACADTDI
ncbi:MAG: hypothetical protein NXI26_24970 [bacterium]|nr:hypothetical protein [bacterium]